MTDDRTTRDVGQALRTLERLAPPTDHLLPTIVATGRRRVRTRRASVALAAAVLVAGSVTVPVLLDGDGDGGVVTATGQEALLDPAAAPDALVAVPPVAAGAAFAVPLLPRGWVQAGGGRSANLYVPEGTRPGGESVYEGKLAFIYSTTAGSTAGWTERVGGRPAAYRTGPDEVTLSVALDSEHQLDIQVPPALELAKEGVLRLAEGVEVLPGAVPGVG